MTDRLLNLAEAAALVGVCERTLRRHVGELRTYRIGRRRLVSAADLDVWLAQRAAPMPIAHVPASRAERLSEPAKRLLARLQWSENGPRASQRSGNTGRDRLSTDQVRPGKSPAAATTMRPDHRPAPTPSAAKAGAMRVAEGTQP